MAKLILKNGATSVILRVKIRDTSKTDESGLTGLTKDSAGLQISTIADVESAAVVYSGANLETIATLGLFAAPTAGKCRIKEVDAVNHPGLYEIQIANARWAVAGAKTIVMTIKGAANAAQVDAEIQLPAVSFDEVAKEATLSDVHADLAGDVAQVTAIKTKTDQITFTTPNRVDASVPASALGIVAALVDMGVDIATVFRPVVMEKGENEVITFRVVDSQGNSVNCAGYTAKLAVKEKLTDAAYKIGPLDGVLSAYTEGVQCVWTFTIPPATTKSMTPFTGKYSCAMYDGGGLGAVMNPGGTEFRLLENLIDVA